MTQRVRETEIDRGWQGDIYIKESSPSLSLIYLNFSLSLSLSGQSYANNRTSFWEDELIFLKLRISMSQGFLCRSRIDLSLIPSIHPLSLILFFSLCTSYRKAVRATLILIPLLGLQYMLTPFRPPPGSSGEQFYDILSAIATSLQVIQLINSLTNY